MSSPHAEKYPGASPGWVGGGKESPQSGLPVTGGVPGLKAQKNQWKSCPQVPHIKKNPGASRRLVGGAPQVPQVGAPPAAGGPPCAHERTWMGERRRRRCADHLSGHILGGPRRCVCAAEDQINLTETKSSALATSCPAIPPTPPVPPHASSVSPNIGPSSCDEGGGCM